MRYEWEIRSWVSRTIGWFVRKDALVAWIYSLLIPLENLHLKFIAKNVDLDFRTNYNSQQKVFAALLNNVFGTETIRVETSSDLIPPFYVYYKIEAKPKKYLFFKSESKPSRFTRFKSESNPSNNFIVYAPASLASDEARLRAWINYYKLAGKNYIIIYE